MLDARHAIAGALGALALGVACAEQAKESAPQTGEDALLSVYTVNEPLRTFAERIGGEHVDVVLPAPPDVDPAFWKPAPSIVAEYQRADLILANGAGYAGWTRHATLSRARLVDTSAHFADRLLAQGAGVTHGHGPEGAHTHAATAFTTWLDPTLAALQARAIAEAFIARRPGAEEDFRAGLRALEADLEALDAQLGAALRPFAGRPVLFSHPVYQYLARRYGLSGHSLHWEPGEQPAASEWSRLEELLAETPASVIFFEGEPHPEVERRLAEMGVRVVVFAPGGNAASEGDWLALMRANAGRVERAASRRVSLSPRAAHGRLGRS